MIGALRIVERNARVYRRRWRGSMFMTFLHPALYLVAMGLGLGRLVDQGPSPIAGGVRFLDFLAPGLLAAVCMQTAMFESSFPVAGKMSWRRNYEAMTATPIRVADVVLGELGWIAVRLLIVAVSFEIVMFVLDVPSSSLSLLAVPGAVLTGLAVSAPVMAFAGSLKGNHNAINHVYRFIITPFFLFSGVFFPIDNLPHALRVFAWFTPLFHGVEPVRGLTLGPVLPGAMLAHVAYLAGVLAIGTVIAIWTFTWRLRT